jgi:hypothetical protein
MPISVYRWPVPDTQAICSPQSIAGAGNLILDGNLAESGGVVFDAFSRSISLTSNQDLSAVNFTITGTLNEQPVSQVIVGPTSNTVSTTQFFDSVTKISTSAAADPIEVGTGATGRTHWFWHNTYAPSGGWAVQIVVTNNINFTLQVTFDDITKTTNPFLVNRNANLTASTIITPNANTLLPNRFSSLLINSSDAAGSLVATFLQQSLMS